MTVVPEPTSLAVLGYRAELDAFVGARVPRHLATLEEVEYDRIDPPVRLAIEVGRAQEFGDLDDRVAVDQQRAEFVLIRCDIPNPVEASPSQCRVRARPGNKIGQDVPARAGL